MLKPDPKALEERYGEIKRRISYACTRAGRSADEVTLIAVSKTFPEAYIRALYDLGHRDFGENKAQELTEKAVSFQHQPSYSEIRWHMIGHLQRNKAAYTVKYADVFHSLDSLRLAKEIDKRAEKERVRLSCLVQVNISEEESKFGLDPVDLESFLVVAKDFENIEICGLMGMGKPARNPETVRPEFQLLKRLQASYSDHLGSRGGLHYLSMGMTQDFEVAIEEGATHVRLGSAIFGERTYANR